jgi:hypothetical protein
MPAFGWNAPRNVEIPARAPDKPDLAAWEISPSPGLRS